VATHVMTMLRFLMMDFCVSFRPLARETCSIVCAASDRRDGGGRGDTFVAAALPLVEPAPEVFSGVVDAVDERSVRCS